MLGTHGTLKTHSAANTSPTPTTLATAKTPRQHGTLGTPSTPGTSKTPFPANPHALVLLHITSMTHRKFTPLEISTEGAQP